MAFKELKRSSIITSVAIVITKKRTRDKTTSEHFAIFHNRPFWIENISNVN